MRIVFYGNHQVDYSSETHHANTLETLGHEVVRLQEPQLTADQVLAEALNCDMFVWVHTHAWQTVGDMSNTLRTLRLAGIPTVTYHLDLWLGLQRQRDMQRDPVWQIEHFFTVDRLMADHLNQNTPVRGHYLPPGVYGPECYIAEPTDRFDVAFVGSRRYHHEWDYRPKLIDWLHSTYGDRFRHYGGDGLGTVRGHALNQVYANARVVVGDTLCIGYDYPDYWSDRCPETLGRGGFLIHPRIRGMDSFYKDGEHLVYYDYGDFAGLKGLIDHYVDHDADREPIRLAGHEHVKENHTYTHRWQTILDTVFA